MAWQVKERQKRNIFTSGSGSKISWFAFAFTFLFFSRSLFLSTTFKSQFIYAYYPYASKVQIFIPLVARPGPDVTRLTFSYILLYSIVVSNYISFHAEIFNFLYHISAATKSRVSFSILCHLSLFSIFSECNAMQV
jgi:hypothetical protein